MEEALKEAFAACRHAETTRTFHARRSEKGSKQRHEDLHAARERLRLAMVPLRSYLGRMQYKSSTASMLELSNRVRMASGAIQAERRKIWKMQTPEGREASRKNERRQRSSDPTSGSRKSDPVHQVTDVHTAGA